MKTKALSHPSQKNIWYASLIDIVYNYCKWQLLVETDIDKKQTKTKGVNIFIFGDTKVGYTIYTELNSIIFLKTNNIGKISPFNCLH